MKQAKRITPATGSEGIPAHIAIIMDGNGRWAKSRGLPKVLGHKKGSEALREIMEGCRQAGVTYLTLYAFSSENWKRPAVEITDLMELLRHYLKREISTLHKNGIRLRIIGDRDKLDGDIRSQINQAEELTRDNTAFNLTVALSYGSRQEMVQAVRQLAEEIAAGKTDAAALTEETLSRRLYTCDLPDPDLLIRTGGEHRLSNFLLWQSAYTELYFTPVLWPDFTVAHLREAIAEFGGRERRYGTTGN